MSCVSNQVLLSIQLYTVLAGISFLLMADGKKAAHRSHNTNLIRICPILKRCCHDKNDVSGSHGRGKNTRHDSRSWTRTHTGEGGSKSIVSVSVRNGRVDVYVKVRARARDMARARARVISLRRSSLGILLGFQVMICAG